MLYIVLLWVRFTGRSSDPVALGGVERMPDGCSFGSVLGEQPDSICCVADLELADLMPLVSTWRLRLLRFPTQGVGWLREFACGFLDMTEC